MTNNTSTINDLTPALAIDRSMQLEYDIDGVTSGKINIQQIYSDIYLQASVTYDPPSLTGDIAASTIVTVTGATMGDFADASFSLDLQEITLFAYVSAANIVTVIFTNNTGNTIDLASGTLRVRVYKK